MILIAATALALSLGGGAADTTLTIARLRYEGGGDWYANPSSLPNLLAAIRDRTTTIALHLVRRLLLGEHDAA